MKYLSLIFALGKLLLIFALVLCNVYIVCLGSNPPCPGNQVPNGYGGCFTRLSTRCPEDKVPDGHGRCLPKFVANNNCPGYLQDRNGLCPTTTTIRPPGTVSTSIKNRCPENQFEDDAGNCEQNASF